MFTSLSTVPGTFSVRVRHRDIRWISFKNSIRLYSIMEHVIFSGRYFHRHTSRLPPLRCDVPPLSDFTIFWLIVNCLKLGTLFPGRARPLLQTAVCRCKLVSDTVDNVVSRLSQLEFERIRCAVEKWKAELICIQWLTFAPSLAIVSDNS